jgi:hypothetical protein
MDCPKGTYLEGCKCPKNTFLSLERDLCDDSESGNEGLDLGEEGMTLETLRVLPGYWRTGNNSSDVRPCPVAEACVGWNVSATYCRGGHAGPYCNLCEDGYVCCCFTPLERSERKKELRASEASAYKERRAPLP